MSSNKQIQKLSTGHFVENDGALLVEIMNKKTQVRWLESVDEFGCTVVMPKKNEDVEETLNDVIALGFSTVFVGVIYTAYAQGIEKIVFDRDIETTVELPVFAW